MRSAHLSHHRGAICPFPAGTKDCHPCFTSDESRQHCCARHELGSSMDCDSARGATPVETTPDWWPYAPEFPHWQVWRGVAGLFYARRPKSSPPKVVRGKDLKTLRERIIKAEVVH